MEDAPLNISALLRNSDHLFDRAFQVVAVKHANGAPFTRANPPTRFRAYLNPGRIKAGNSCVRKIPTASNTFSSGWISGAGGNRLIGGYTMVTCMRAALAFANRFVRCFTFVIIIP